MALYSNRTNTNTLLSVVPNAAAIQQLSDETLSTYLNDLPYIGRLNNSYKPNSLSNMTLSSTRTKRPHSQVTTTIKTNSLSTNIIEGKTIDKNNTTSSSSSTTIANNPG
jgi:hypothetical protein